jgi:hypothetical protein
MGKTALGRLGCGQIHAVLWLLFPGKWEVWRSLSLSPEADGSLQGGAEVFLSLRAEPCLGDSVTKKWPLEAALPVSLTYSEGKLLPSPPRWRSSPSGLQARGFGFRTWVLGTSSGTHFTGGKLRQRGGRQTQGHPAEKQPPAGHAPPS